MLTPTQFGAQQSPPITKQAVHAAINAKPCRIKPKPRRKVIAGKVYHEISDDAILLPGRNEAWNAGGARHGK